MRAPLGWVAVGAILGAWTWPEVPLWFSTVAMAMGAAILRSQPTPTRSLWLCLFGLGLGGFAGHLQPAAPAFRSPMIGRVLSTSGQSAMVRTDTGKAWMRFGPGGPRQGEWISADVVPGRARPVLPGGWQSERRPRLAKALPVRVRSWVGQSVDAEETTNAEGLLYAPILKALATGDRGEVPSPQLTLLRNTGTIHLLAISGLHVGMVAAGGAFIGWLLSRPMVLFGWVVLARLGPALGALLAAGTYGTLVGWPVSTQRAAWMIAAGATATVVGRGVSPWQLIGIAALAVVLQDPSAVASLGFLMSFGAVAALIGWMPWATAWLRPSHPWLLRRIGQSLAATLAATLGTLPVTAWVFQQVAPSAPLANLIAVPLFAGIAVPMSLLGHHINAPYLLTIADRAVEWTMTWLTWVDWGTVSVAVGPIGATLLAATIFASSRPKIALLLGVIAFFPPHNTSKFEVIFPDVGQGSSVLISFPDGKKWLVDGGPPGSALCQWLRRSGVRELDAVFLSHPDIDHIGGLSQVIDGIKVHRLWVPRRPKVDERRFHNLWRDAHQKGIPSGVFGNAHGSNDNNEGLVIRTRLGAHSFLLMGDLGADPESRMVDRLSHFSVVQVGHHGSKTSSSIDFIQRTAPIYAVIQAGKNNRYGHPAAEVVERWSPKTVLRTDMLGTLRFQSDGKNLKTEHWSPTTGWASVSRQLP
jgi:competence protein ComEC